MDSLDLYEKSIILIGPSGIGKSTIGRELARITGMRQISIDGIANRDRRDGVRGKFSSSDDYKLYLLSRLIEEAKRTGAYGVVDFGAGHSIFENEYKFLQAQQLLGNFRNIVLLQYSDDFEESLRVINARSTGDTRDNLHFLTCGCNEALATMVVNTKDKTPEEIAGEILERIKENIKGEK